MKRNKDRYDHTIYACYIGYITQAIVNNFAPLLFLTFQSRFQVSLSQLAALVSINFGVQLLVDFASSLFVDKIGYRICMVGAHLMAAVGLAGLYFFPMFFPNAFTGILAAVVIYAVGGGLLEVLVSPIVEACPTEEKETAMSLLHSFYCWGHVLVVVCSTAFFAVFGLENWGVMACIWAVIPLGNALYFSRVPIPMLVEEGKGATVGELFKNKVFWQLFVMMVCAGASEQGMSQWASAFAESSLHVSKTVGDLAGPCSFAVMMGLARAMYGKFGASIKLETFMNISSVLCIISYAIATVKANPFFGLFGCALCGLSVGIMWPGTFSIAAKTLRNGGTAMFALLALAGDLGCGTGPAVVGYVSEMCGGDLQNGLLAAIFFPVLLMCCNIVGASRSDRYQRLERRQ
ncbi:MAG: MFS transporter [Lachnospiraceae bacterium]|nr:MFS transporter [Robinsoniella sp.]MDY3766724.1 MFS transporter [Lachnospiraceae bacterium]